MINNSKPKYIFTFYATGTPSPHAPFTPAPQYENEFQDVTAPRIPSFNHVEEDHEAKHWFVRRQPRPLNDTLIGKYICNQQCTIMNKSYLKMSEQYLNIRLGLIWTKLSDQVDKPCTFASMHKY